MKEYKYTGLKSSIIAIRNSVSTEEHKPITAIETIPGDILRFFATGNTEGWVSLWDGGSFDLRWTDKSMHSARVNSILNLQTGKHFLSACEKGGIIMWSIGDQVALVIKKESGVAVKAMAYAYDGKTIFFAQGKSIFVWNIITNRKISCFDDKELITSLIYCNKTGILIWGMANGTVNKCQLSIEISLDNQNIKAEILTEAFSSPITSLCFINNEGQPAVAIGAEDEVVQIYDPAKMLLLNKIVPIEGYQTRKLIYLYDSKSLLQVNNSGSICVIGYLKDQVESKKKMTKKLFSDQSINISATYLGDGKNIIVSGEIGKLDLWFSR